MLAECGTIAYANEMPRFVILYHNHPSPHWDLFLEQGDVLKAWRLLALPQEDTEIPAEANHDHCKLYLDYEGQVSGDRGTVTRVAAGEYEGTLGETWRVKWNAGFATMTKTEGGLLFRWCKSCAH